MADLLNICRFIAGSTGTADFADGTAEQGFRNLAAAGATNTRIYPYRAENATRTEWEIGYGTYSSGGAVLARTTVVASSNANAKVNFGTNPVVMITPLKDEFLNSLSTPQFAGIELSDATQNTLTAAGGVLFIENKPLLMSGKHTIYVPASGMFPRTTNGADRNLTEYATNDIMVPRLEFDQTTEEGAGFWVWFPKSWNGSTVTFQAIWSASAGSGGVVWNLRGRAYADDDAIDQALGTGQTSTDTLLAANDMHVSPESAAITIGGSPAAERPTYFEIRRMPTDGSDTLNADARLIGIKVFYTVNAATDA